MPNGSLRLRVLGLTVGTNKRRLRRRRSNTHEEYRQVQTRNHLQNLQPYLCNNCHIQQDLLPMCYRCSTTNPLLNPKGNICVHCAHPFIFSFVSFEILPVVEFAIDPSISENEAKDLIEAEPPLDEEKEAKAIRNALSARPTAPVKAYEPVVMNRSALVSMHRTEVTICQWPKPLKSKYYLNLIPEISITKCESCNKLFHTDDYEMHVLQEGKCPFCNRQNDRANHEDEEDTLDI